MTLDDLKHAQRQRLLFLDRCFTWRGLARRRDLTDRFGISNAQAANDFRTYLARFQQNVPAYDAQLKAYVASPHHEPVTPSTMQEAFSVLDTNEAERPSAELPRAKRWLDPVVASHIYNSIIRNRKIEIHYTSISSGETAPQWVAPTRFTFDGESVHFRAFSFKRNQYRNFHPARINPDYEFESTELDAPLPPDKEWNTLSIIWLRPSARLSKSQADVVRREFGFTADLLRIEVRQALEFDFDRKWGLNEKDARLERMRTEYLSLCSG